MLNCHRSVYGSCFLLCMCHSLREEMLQTHLEKMHKQFSASELL